MQLIYWLTIAFGVQVFFMPSADGRVTREATAGPTTEATQLDFIDKQRQTIQSQEGVITEKQTRIEELERELADKDLLMAQCETEKTRLKEEFAAKNEEDMEIYDAETVESETEKTQLEEEFTAKNEEEKEQCETEKTQLRAEFANQILEKETKCEEARMEIESQTTQEAERMDNKLQQCASTVAYMDTNLLQCGRTIADMDNKLLRYKTTMAFMDTDLLQCDKTIVQLSAQIRNPGWIKVEKKHYQDTQCPNVGNFWGEHPEAASLDACKDACLRDTRCTAISFYTSQTGTSNSCTLRACSFPIPLPLQSGVHDSYYLDRQGDRVLASPNYPRNYSANYEKTKTLQTAEGEVLILQFTAFDLEFENECDFDYLRITDGDGTVLMEKKCGFALLPTFKSKSNVVNVHFKTDQSGESSGWSILWTNGPMDQWTNGPILPWTNGPMDQWTNGPMDQWSNGPMNQWANGPMNQWTNGPMDQWTNEPRDQWTNGPIDQSTNGPIDQWTETLATL